MAERDEARQQGGSKQISATTAGETTGAGILQQSASAGDGQQFGGSSRGDGQMDGQGQQSQRGVGGDGARPPKDLLKDTAEDLRRGGGEVARTATRRMESIADEQKSRASGYIETLGRAVQAASETLEDEGFGTSARAIGQVVEQIEDLAQTLRSRDPKQLVDDVSGFARQNPAMFLGASMLAGFGLARFLKSGVMTEPQQTTQSSGGGTP